MEKRLRQCKSRSFYRIAVITALLALTMTAFFMVHSVTSAETPHFNIRTDQYEFDHIQSKPSIAGIEKLNAGGSRTEIRVLPIARWQDYQEDTRAKKRWGFCPQNALERYENAAVHSMNFLNMRLLRQERTSTYWGRMEKVRLQI